MWNNQFNPHPTPLIRNPAVWILNGVGVGGDKPRLSFNKGSRRLSWRDSGPVAFRSKRKPSMLWGESGDHMAFRESIGYFVIFKTRVLCGGSLALREVTGGKINDHLLFHTFQSRTQDFYLLSLPPFGRK